MEKLEKPIDIIYGEQVHPGVAARAHNEGLWLGAKDLRRVSGFELKPEGFCRGETCVPVPAKTRGELVSGDALNLAALARLLGQPVVRDDEHAVWCIGEAAQVRRSRLTSLQAPDFTLPDLDGREHSLSQYRGRKILLASWASW